jgi:hypothetical protein
LLDAITLVYVQLDERDKISKSYRNMLPREDFEELERSFSENILFAAESISHGFTIRGIERFTPLLFEPSKTLCASLDALRYVFRMAALDDLNSPFTTTPSIVSVLKDFDRAWTSFEELVCVAYHEVNDTTRDESASSSPRNNSARLRRRGTLKLEELDMATVILSEAVLHGLENGLVHLDDINELEPSLMIAIPRLAVLRILFNPSDLIPISDGRDGFRWFRGKAEEIKELSGDVCALDSESRALLEKSLATGDWKGENGSDTLKMLFVRVCAVSDVLQSGKVAKEISTILQKVFMMHRSSQ